MEKETLDDIRIRMMEENARARTVTITMTWWEQATIIAALKGFKGLLSEEASIQDVEDAIRVMESKP